MKKTMLFFTALLFSLNANAASLNLAGNSSNTGTIGFETGDVVTAAWSSTSSGASVSDIFTISSDAATTATLSLTFNPMAANTSVSIFDGLSATGLNILKVGSLGVLEYTWVLEAATNYVLNIFISNAAAGSNYDLRLATGISEVPVPAALWLFAPALMGLLTLRRKAKLATA